MVADYTYAQRAADGSHIGLDLSGDGVACTTASGAFSVDQISLDGSGNPVTFSSRFEFHCNAEDPAVIGAVFVQRDGGLPNDHHARGRGGLRWVAGGEISTR